jgi:signal transduction histidine kinase
MNARMSKSLSTRLLLAVLLAVAVPFGLFALFLEREIADRLTVEIAQETLLGLAGDLAEGVDEELRTREQLLKLEAGSQLCVYCLGDYEFDRIAMGEGDLDALQWGAAETRDVGLLGDRVRLDEDGSQRAADKTFRLWLTKNFRRSVRSREHSMLLVLIHASGRAVCISPCGYDGQPYALDHLEFLFDYRYAAEPWFERVMGGATERLAPHSSPLFEGFLPDDSPDDRQVGFVVPIYTTPLEEGVDPGFADEPEGMLLGLTSWEAFVQPIRANVIKDAFRGMVGRGEQPSPYAWIWGADGDTILAHPSRELIGKSVSGDVGLPQMVEDLQRAKAQGIRRDLYRPYTFEGVPKHAAFARTANPDQGGFDWFVGVGIDDSDIQAASREQRQLLVRGTLAVLLFVVLWVMVVARRTTQPILALEQHTRRVAAGGLEERIEIDSDDEVGRLARAFNQMTAELAAQRKALIKAEKDAAWREMARQVAHDLKNPLTPIQLSLDLYDRARREQSPKEPEILERTLELMRRQVRALKEIATDFYEFTGGAQARPERFRLEDLVSEVFDLHRAWAEEQEIELELTGPGAGVHVDPGKLRRVVTNLVTNAFQASPRGGRLTARVSAEGQRACLELIDRGEGLSAEVQEHLFEPYFTTKSGGTGLGLAIAARVLDEMKGGIELTPNADGPGACARLWLPLHIGAPESGGEV